ncbi:hypothetical protein RJ639_030502 [Escallonia herrerae]|uniref:BAG domain-containing protein n=1 Tax=Escallonia herrerae TaxID=1293975 RepID=A0AA89BCI2_9ASTE|nr:hypothetical protein RJ639_030502 [Escallonia herrerae]
MIIQLKLFSGPHHKKLIFRTSSQEVDIQISFILAASNKHKNFSIIRYGTWLSSLFEASKPRWIPSSKPTITSPHATTPSEGPQRPSLLPAIPRPLVATSSSLKVYHRRHPRCETLGRGPSIVAYQQRRIAAASPLSAGRKISTSAPPSPCRAGSLELIQKDPKERVRVNETLRALLLKLDSVRGVDLDMRDLRKGILKKAIALQVLSGY